MAVTGFEVLRRQPYHGGRAFGEAGAYERIDGRLHYAVDPEHPRNTDIVDLESAECDDQGLVRFSGDVCLLLPLDRARANRRLLFEVPNRGQRRLTRYFLRVPSAEEDEDIDKIPPGDGFLMRHGYTIAWIGWQCDVDRSKGPMALDAPLALRDGRPIPGQTSIRFRASVRHTTHWLADPHHLAHPAVDLNEQDAVLFVSEYRDGPKQVIPRDQWRFASDLDGELKPDPHYVHYPAGFEPGRVYDIVYTTDYSPVVGTGMLAMRDAVSFLRYAGTDDNPCAGRIDWTFGFGISQNARLLRHFLWLGLNLDEHERMAFDGLLPTVGGGRRGEFNHRFARPSVRPMPSPAYLPPFDDAGILARQRELGGVPKMIQTNASSEYWRGDGALIHVTPDGTRDLPDDPGTRQYYFAGTQHQPGEIHQPAEVTDGTRGRYRNNWVDYTPLLRAALVNLDRWVAEGIEPPPSARPRLGDGTLRERREVLRQLASGPVPDLHIPDPERLPMYWQVDLGPDAARGIVRFPVETGDPYPAFAPALDTDGNEIGGLRLPDLTVPVATHLGWNPIHPANGAPEQILDFNGSTHCFPRTRAERERAGDPRRSLAERYESRDRFLELVRNEARVLVQQRYLLEEDIDVVVADAAARYDEATRTSGHQ